MFPEVRHKFDAMEALDRYGEYIGVPASIVKSDDEAKAAADAEMKQTMAQRAAETGGQMADAAKKLSETKVGEAEQSMLDRMLGGPQGVAQ